MAPEVIYDLSGPLALDELYEAKVGEPIGEGSHLLRVFLSRSNHESVKMPTAFAMAVFHCGARTPGFTIDRNRPMLTYSRPQGCSSDRTGRR